MSNPEAPQQQPNETTNLQYQNSYQYSASESDDYTQPTTPLETPLGTNPFDFTNPASKLRFHFSISTVIVAILLSIFVSLVKYYEKSGLRPIYIVSVIFLSIEWFVAGILGVYYAIQWIRHSRVNWASPPNPPGQFISLFLWMGLTVVHVLLLFAWFICALSSKAQIVRQNHFSWMIIFGTLVTLLLCFTAYLLVKIALPGAQREILQHNELPGTAR